MNTVTLVSYLNSLPFLYGLEEYPPIRNKIKILLDYPSKCAENILTGKADIGLIPVGALNKIPGYTIISDYCIGSDGEVATVLLLSQVPLEKIEKILLDYQSATSVKLIKILAKDFWKISPVWINAAENYENKIQGSTAGLVIGDRTFTLKDRFKYVYDLSEEWKKFTGLPFVFAVWITTKKLDKQFRENINNALKFGVNHINETIRKYRTQIKILSNGFDIEGYYKKFISYDFDEPKKKATELFLRKINNKF